MNKLYNTQKEISSNLRIFLENNVNNNCFMLGPLDFEEPKSPYLWAFLLG